MLSSTVFKSLRNGGTLRKALPAISQQVRYLNLHEYQSKALMDKFGVATQRGAVASTPAEALKVAEDLKAAEYVVKAQIHAGGRGKGVFDDGFKGGVQITTDKNEVPTYAEKMLGKKLKTKQTKPEGAPVNEVLVLESVDILTEKYFAILMDRAYNGPVMVASPEGGVDIEEVAESNPDAIFKEGIDIFKGPQDDQLNRLASNLGFAGDEIPKATKVMRGLYDLFIATDATQVEINPLAEVTIGGKSEKEVLCVDAKINFDDNAEFRQKEIFAQNDPSQEDPRDLEAAKHDLNYIGLDGNIGCMVNGAGLAMATMDIIQLYGAMPANFLDVGGGANAQQIAEAFRILTSDPQVEVLLVNIFGGIMRCDIIAQGIIDAAKIVGLEVPLVVRLEGTNSEEGRQLLADSGLKLTPTLDLDDAAATAVKALNK